MLEELKSSDMATEWTLSFEDACLLDPLVTANSPLPKGVSPSLTDSKGEAGEGRQDEEAAE